MSSRKEHKGLIIHKSALIKNSFLNPISPHNFFRHEHSSWTWLNQYSAGWPQRQYWMVITGLQTRQNLRLADIFGTEMSISAKTHGGREQNLGKGTFPCQVQGRAKLQTSGMAVVSRSDLSILLLSPWPFGTCRLDLAEIIYLRDSTWLLVEDLVATENWHSFDTIGPFLWEWWRGTLVKR